MAAVVDLGGDRVVWPPETSSRYVVSQSCRGIAAAAAAAAVVVVVVVVVVECDELVRPKRNARKPLYVLRRHWSLYSYRLITKKNVSLTP